MNSDPFSVLGIPSTATEDEIKSAYRKLAKKYHPDLNPGDQAAEQKMREVNEAYTKALQYRRNGGRYSDDTFGSSGANAYRNTSYTYTYGPWGYSGQSGDYRSGGGSGGNPFSDDGFGFDPFSAFFSGQRSSGPYTRQRTYANPELETVGKHVLARRYADAVMLLNRIPVHDADWHALYARADFGLGNRISALDHARSAVRMAPQDEEYQTLLSRIESGRQAYRQTQAGGYDFRSALCANPCLTCCAANILLNCCLGGCGRFGYFC